MVFATLTAPVVDVRVLQPGDRVGYGRAFTADRSMRVAVVAAGYSDGILEAAKQYPEVAFVNASGTTNAPNLEGFYARTYQGWYLAGMAAAGASKSGKIGILGGFPVGVVNWDVNAFTLGVRARIARASSTPVIPGIKTSVITRSIAARGASTSASACSGCPDVSTS